MVSRDGEPEPEPVGAGCFLPQGAGAGFFFKPGGGAGAAKNVLRGDGSGPVVGGPPPPAQLDTVHLRIRHFVKHEF